MTDQDRPLGVKLLSILSVALGVSIVIVAIIALVTASDAIIENVQIYISLDVVIAAAVSSLISTIFIVVGIGMWYLRGWTKSIMQVFSGLSVVFFPLKGLIIASTLAEEGSEISTPDIIGIISAVFGIVLSVIILLYLSRPKVIIAFESMERALTKKRIRIIEEKIEQGRQRSHAGEITKSEFAKLKSDCIAEERLLRARIRHFEKVRLSRERKIKDKAKAKKEAKEEKMAKRKEKIKERVEKRKEAKKAAEEKREKEGEKGEKKSKKKKDEEEDEEEGEISLKKVEEKAEEKGGEGGKKTRKKSRKEKAEEEGE